MDIFGNFIYNCPSLEATFFSSVQISHSVMSDSLQPHGLAARQASRSIANSWSLLKLMSIKLVMPSNHLILCCLLLLLPSVFPQHQGPFFFFFLRFLYFVLKFYIIVLVLSQLFIFRWPKYWSFSFSISPSSEYSGLISFSMDQLDFFAVKRLSRVFSNTTVQKHQFFCAQLSLQSNSHIHT